MKRAASGVAGATLATFADIKPNVGHPPTDIAITTEKLPNDIPHDIPHDSRHRLHPRGAGGGGPRSPVHGPRRLGPPVPAGACTAEQAKAGDRIARWR